MATPSTTRKRRCKCCGETLENQNQPSNVCSECADGTHDLHCGVPQGFKVTDVEPVRAAVPDPTRVPSEPSIPERNPPPSKAPDPLPTPSVPTVEPPAPQPAPPPAPAEAQALEVATARAGAVVGKNKLQSFGALLQKALPKVEDIVPRGYSPQRLFVAAYMAVERNPDLLNCSANSVLRGVIVGAQLGLDVSGVGGHAYLVPYKKDGQLEAQFIAGWRGLADLACRSGRVAWILPGVVRERDDFAHELAPLPTLIHRAFQGADPGKVTHFYAVAAFKDGSPTMSIVMTKSEVDAIRERSKSSKSPASPWNNDYPEMGKKTAVRRICKYLPSNPDLDRALAEDADLEVSATGFGFDADAEVAEMQPPRRKVTETQKVEAPAS